MRLAELQNLLDHLSDAALESALKSFAAKRKEQEIEILLSMVRKSDRDTMKEAFQAGKIDAYETLFADLEAFARDSIAEAQGL